MDGEIKILYEGLKDFNGLMLNFILLDLFIEHTISHNSCYLQK
jgi:hypothetical protein